MRARAVVLVLIAGLLGAPASALAQAPTGAISGHIVSVDGQPLPGVLVSVTGAALQGTRTATSSGNGDYLIPLLPPGDYKISFEIGDFQPVREVRSVAGTQTVLLDVKMSLASVNVSVTVVGEARPFMDTATVATNFKQDLMAELATNRTLDAVMLMAPAVHATGPRGAFTIAGSQSYENLFTLNGAVITENLRGSPFTLYIEDALQEITVATSGISAEYGRFDGGLASAVTKSGGNLFSGSFRTSFANDNWRSFSPYETTQLAANPTLQLKTNKTVPTYEATFGGPVKKERLWFFGAMRAQTQESTRTTVFTFIPYVRANDEQRYEGKLTYALKPGHSLQGSFTKTNQVLKNNTNSSVMDLASLTNTGQPQDLMSLHYTGLLKPNFSVEAQYSDRHLRLTDVGANTKDLINGTLVQDRSRGNSRYWSPTFCSGSTCDGDEQRNNSDVIVKGSYFLSDKAYGSHNVVFGYDRYDDNILANTHTSGSDYRVLGTSSIFQGTSVFPQFLPGSTIIQYNPLDVLSKGSHLVTHSLFLNDSWRVSNRLSFGLGLRWDKNAATDGGLQNVGNKGAFGPRLSAVWDPEANGRWSVTGSYARYVMALTSNLAASTTAAGNASTFQWIYQGPAVNPDPTATLVTTDAGLKTLFDWFIGNGGRNMPPVTAVVPGISMQIQHPLSSPYSDEYGGGVSRQLGGRGTVRLDATYRKYQNFYSLRVDQATGKVGDTHNNVYDLGVIENTNHVSRKYAGMTTQMTYRAGRGIDLGGNYTLSHSYGNCDCETVGGGPSGALVDSYPEYKNAAWDSPQGDLAIDQRHRVRLWQTYTTAMPQSAGTLTFGLLEQMGSGSPYGAVGPVNSVPYVIPPPGYQTPPSTPGVDYYFTSRDAFHTAATYRTDLSVNYSHGFRGPRPSQPELFFHGEVLNVFNRFQLCGCGGSVFTNGGITDLTTINTAVKTPANTPAMQPFNPFTTTPVQGVNWDKTATFGAPLSALAYTAPRIFRFSVGVRF